MTAVTWLISEIHKTKYLEADLVDKALKMEKKQAKDYAKFAVIYDREKELLKRLEYLESIEQERIKKHHEKYNHKNGDLLISKNLKGAVNDFTIIRVEEVLDNKWLKAYVIASSQYKTGKSDVLWDRIRFEKICGYVREYK